MMTVSEADEVMFIDLVITHYQPPTQEKIMGIQYNSQKIQQLYGD